MRTSSPNTVVTNPTLTPIGEMEQEIKEDAYSIQADIIRDVCSYDRDDSSEWESHLFTDAAAHMCRRNEYAEQGIERMGKDYGLIEEHEDGSEEWNDFTQQTFRRTVRNVERTKIEGYYDDDDAYGARWIAPHNLIDPHLVNGNLRDALEKSWTIDPHNPDGETATWHLRTEEAIERQLAWLKDEDVIDEDDTFNLRIDYTTRNYSKHSSTDSDRPMGVHNRRISKPATLGRNSRAPSRSTGGRSSSPPCPIRRRTTSSRTFGTSLTALGSS